MAGKTKTTDQDFPKKLYYSISEVAKIAEVKAHVLRYWESEFPTLKPRKTRSGSRRYRPADIDAVLTIKDLLYEQGFKIAGARKALRDNRQTTPTVTAPATQMALKFESMSEADKLAFIKAELDQILKLIREIGGAPSAAAKEMKAEG